MCLYNPILLQSLLKQQSELSSKLEGAVAQYKADIADLQDQNEKLAVRNQKLNGELKETQQENDAKAEQLKGIQQKAAEASEKLLKMSFDEIKECLRDIIERSTPGYLPHPEPESVAPPKKLKPVSTPSQSKVTANRERRSSETCEQKNVTLRKPSIPPTKSTSMPRNSKK